MTRTTRTHAGAPRPAVYQYVPWKRPPGRHGSLAGRTPGPDQCRTGWMMFRHAGPLRITELKAEHVHIGDIVEPMAKLARWNGQTRELISVLWHSLMVTELCRPHREAMLRALFHDAAEAYVGDWIRPIQDLVGAELKETKSDIEDAIDRAAGLGTRHDGDEDSERTHAIMKIADQAMQEYEMAADFGYGESTTWHPGPRAETIGQIEAAMGQIGHPADARRPDQATRLEQQFLAMTDELAPAHAAIRSSFDSAIVLTS